MIDPKLKKKILKQGLCDTCEVISERISSPGGLIFKTDHFHVNHCLESPIPGHLIVSPIRHIFSISEFTLDELNEFGPLIHKIRAAQNKVLGIHSIYWALKERPGTHFHMYLFPMHEWIKTRFGSHIKAITTATDWAKKNMNSQEVNQEIDSICEKIRKQLT